MVRHLCAALLVATGCQTYAQHRAALVPHQTPLTTDGQPLESTGELALGASNVKDLASPQQGNPYAGDAVPSTQLRGSLDFRASPNVSIGVVAERGLERGSQAVSPSEPPVNNGDVTGYGGHMTVSIPTGTPGLRVALATEVLFWYVPWVQYTTCIDNCSVPGFTYSDRGTSSVTTIAFGIIPSYRSGRVTVFGGFTARNHPTITEKTETDVPLDPDVQQGPYNVTLHAGADVDLIAGARLSLIAHKTVTKDPIDYATGLAAMLTIPFGSAPKPVQTSVPWGAQPAQ